MEQMILIRHPAARRPPRMHHHRASPPVSQRTAPASHRPRPLATSKRLGQSRQRARRSGYPCESACLSLNWGCKMCRAACPSLSGGVDAHMMTDLETCISRDLIMMTFCMMQGMSPKDMPQAHGDHRTGMTL